MNLTKEKVVDTKVVDSMIFGIRCNIFSQQTSSFPKFLLKKAMEKYPV